MTNSNDIIKIDTPENVTFDYEVAGIGSRFLAALVDTFIIGALQVAVIGALIFMLFKTGSDTLFSGDAFFWIIAAAGLIGFILLWGYYIGFEIFWNGQTPGKRWVGLRVIRVDGTPITISESIIRNLVRLIDILPTGYGVGVAVMFINTNSRRLGDLTAGTIVVYDSKMGTLENATANVLDTNIVQSSLPEGFPLEKLTQHNLEIIEEFLMRRAELSNRSVLAKHILKSLLAQWEIPEQTIPLDRAEDILAAMYKTIRDRNIEKGDSA